MSGKLRVVLYSKPNCGLCEEMKEQMRRADCAQLYSLEEFNIEDDPEIYRRYRYDIPVLFIDGVEAFRHRLVAEEFRSYLTALSQSQA